jgi:hypothetical protein
MKNILVWKPLVVTTQGEIARPPCIVQKEKEHPFAQVGACRSISKPYQASNSSPAWSLHSQGSPSLYLAKDPIVTK